MTQPATTVPVTSVKSHPTDNEKKIPFRLVCFTIYDMAIDMEKLASNFTYLAFGKEICPTTKKDHYQCFAYNELGQKWPWWQKKLSPHHFEKCIGNLHQQEKYCSKDGQYTEYGVKPMGNGKKRTLLDIKERIDNGEKLYDIQEEESAFQTVCMYERPLKAYENRQRFKRAKTQGFKIKNVHIHIGEPNSGKTRAIFDAHPAQDIYTMPRKDGKWFGTYDGQPVVLFDDVDASTFMPVDLFLQLTDGYPIEVEIKGGFVPWTPEHIYFTSNKPLDLWWNDLSHLHLQAATRRVTEFRNF